MSIPFKLQSFQPIVYRFSWVLVSLLLVAPTAVPAEQPSATTLWSVVEPPLPPEGESALEPSIAAEPILYEVHVAALETTLRRAPREILGASPIFVEQVRLPMPDGSSKAFRIEESPIMEPQLAARFPGIRTFRLQGVEDPRLTGRLSHDLHGLQALILTPGGVVQINPDRDLGHPYYRSLWERPDPRELLCQTPALTEPSSARVDGRQLGNVPFLQGSSALTAVAAAMSNPSGDVLRIYRLAVATTGEYYQGRDQGSGDADVLASIVGVINRLNAVYEVEVAIRFVLIGNNDEILFSDPNTDNYSNNQPCTMRNENTPNINATIDEDDYDVGHVFGSAGGGGCAGGGVVCDDDNKGNGASGLRTDLPPGQEGFSGYRLVAHEMGHQFGAGHTWSGSNGSCTAGQFSANDAFEPLSGSTLMAYSGICGGDNVKGNTPDDPYFHTRSFDEIVNFSTLGDGADCALGIGTGNAVPVVDAGPDFTVPQETPFVLTGTAVDADDALLSYAWEQFDATPVRVSPLVDNGDNPLFRSFLPVFDDPSRTFPQPGAIFGLVNSPGELLPTTDRMLTFRLTARDHRFGGGGVDYDTTKVFVEGPPFAILFPNGGETLHAGCEGDVLWQVGGGAVADEVDLLLAVNSGFLEFPLLTSTANDGAESLETACTASTTARIRANAVDNIFFDVSDADFTIEANPPEIVLAAVGGEVDDQCSFELLFDATVTDDCSVSTGDVSVHVTEISGQATLGVPVVQKLQSDPATVEVDGSVLVTDLTGPATVQVEVTAADGCGFETLATNLADVEDTTPPEIQVELDPESLWPPNHRMNPILATVGVQDNCPLTSFVLTSVSSDEPDDAVGGGDGRTVDDIQDADLGTPDLELLLRAERLGSGDGRVYTVTYTAADGSGNEASDSAFVTVPKNQSP